MPWNHGVRRISSLGLPGWRLALFMLCSSLANACSCSYDYISDETVRNAKSVFVFQLISARLINEPSEELPENRLQATVSIVKSLRGAATVKSFDYSTFWCCGSRLEVGKYYAAILEDVPVTSFFGHAGNLIALGDDWDDWESRAKLLDRVVAGKLSFQKAVGEFASNIGSPPPPPPPCPNVQHKRESPN